MSPYRAALCFTTMAEFNESFPLDGHWGCLPSSAVTKLYCIITEQKEQHETLIMRGLEARWDRMNCCCHVNRTTLGSGSLCASLPCINRGETHRSSLRGPLTVVSLLGWHISIMWSHYVKYPKSYMAGGYVLGIYLSYLRLGLQCGKSTGFGSQELGSSLSSAFYLCDHWKPS